MNAFPCKAQPSISRLKLSDQKEIETLQQVVQELLSDQMLNEYIALRKERCELGTVQAKILEESERPFIAFLKEKASEYIGAVIEEKLMNYEKGNNELYKTKALSLLKNSAKTFAKSTVTQNK